jgi:hypothetical protein
MASDATASLGEDQIGRIGIHMQHHIAGMVSDDSVGVSGSVIEELVTFCSGVAGRTGLLRGDFVEGWEHDWIYCPCVV